MIYGSVMVESHIVVLDVRGNFGGHPIVLFQEYVSWDRIKHARRRVSGNVFRQNYSRCLRYLSWYMIRSQQRVLFTVGELTATRWLDFNLEEPFFEIISDALKELLVVAIKAYWLRGASQFSRVWDALWPSSGCLSFGCNGRTERSCYAHGPHDFNLSISVSDCLIVEVQGLLCSMMLL